MLSFDVVTSVVAITLLYLWWRRYRPRMTYGCPLPPGPKKLPLIGNLLDMPKGLEWEAYARWGKQYNSPIIHMDVSGMSLVVVNAAEGANDLFEKRGAIYSSRVRMPMINELMGWSFHFAFMPYGSEWRACRRIFHEEFHPEVALRFRPQVLNSTHYMLRQLLDTPEDFMSHLRHLAGRTIMSVAYGIDILPKNDPYIEYAIKVVVGNTWAILQDETMYPDPSNFNPERFLRDGKLNPDVRDPEIAAFGYGRYMASAAVWIAVASVLATFDITKAVEEDGTTIEPSQEYLNNLVCYPPLFKCSIKPRSREAENSVQGTAIVGSL